MRIKKISILEVEYIAYQLAKELMEWDEPIPEFGTRYPGRLEGCLAQPFQTFEGSLYPGLVKKAAMLFYFMIKNHPFENGNKRIAVTTFLYFLSENNLWLETSNELLYNFAKEVAESDPVSKTSVAKKIEEFIQQYKKIFLSDPT